MNLKYNPENPDILRKYARENTYFDGSFLCISGVFNVDRITIYNWTKTYPEFAQAVEDVREIANEKIESALFKAAFGYDYSEQTTKTTSSGSVEETNFRKHQTPNAAAMKLWLTNRKAGYWRDCQDNTEGSAELVIHIQNDIEEK